MKTLIANPFQKPHVLRRGASDQYSHSTYYGPFIKKEKKKWTPAFSFNTTVKLFRIYHILQSALINLPLFSKLITNAIFL